MEDWSYVIRLAYGTCTINLKHLWNDWKSTHFIPFVEFLASTKPYEAFTIYIRISLFPTHTCKVSDRCSGAFWNRGEGLLYTKPSAYPYSNFPKCPLRSSLAQVSLFAILTMSSVSIIDLWQCIGSCSGEPASWCFLGSSWVVGGQKMYALKSPIPQVMSNTNRFCLV